MTDGSRFDRSLDRAAKLAGVLTPVVLAVVGGVYTYNKDVNDSKSRDLQVARDLSQKQYANLTALLPMLLSKDPASVSAALSVYVEEAKDKQAPQSLQGVIFHIGETQPEHRAEAQIADQAATLQTTGKCKSGPDGLFIQVENSPEQLRAGQLLAAALKQGGGTPAIQGVQRVDSVPQQTQVRYYFSKENDPDASAIIQTLQQYGFSGVQKVDLSQLYQKVGCPVPHSFELWVGERTPLDADGRAKAS